MAKTLNQVFGFTLGNMVAGALQEARTVKSQQNARKEADFQSSVAEGLMSYPAQVKYREEQLAEEKKSSYPDKDLITSIETSLKTIKRLQRYDVVRTKYQSALDDYIGGKESINNYISVLSDQLAGETDPEIRTELSNELSKAKSEKVNNEKAAITNRATLAQKDGSVALIEKSITEVKDKQASALLSGRDDEAAMWGQTLVSLNATKMQNSTQDAVNDFKLKNAQGAMTATGKLGFYNEQVTKADGTTPFVLNNVRYNSAKDYWSQERGDYLNGTFFSDLKTDLDAETARISSQAAFGQIPVQRLQVVSDIYNGLKSNVDLAPWTEKIEQSRVASLTDMVDDLATKITQEAGDTGDVNKAIQAISGIESRFGISANRAPFPGEAGAGKTAATIVNKDLPSVKSSIPQTVSDARVYELSRTLSQQGLGRTIEPDLFTGANFLAKARQGATEADLITSIQSEIKKQNPNASFSLTPAPVTPAPVQPIQPPVTPQPTPPPAVNPPTSTPTPQVKSDKYDYNASNLSTFYKGAIPAKTARATMFEQYGLGSAKDYQGSIPQNNSLLAKLKEVL